eukprot:Em0023g547a
MVEECKRGILQPVTAALQPVTAALQKIVLYRAINKLYVVGSIDDHTYHRILKIDRTASHGDACSFVEEDEGGEYTEIEMKELIRVLDQCTVDGRGLEKVATAFGIVGCVANIGGHMIYEIEDTSFYPISNPSSNPAHPCESKYLKIFQNVDLSSNFYFSYSYDLSLSLQCQMRSNPNHAPSCMKFVWNEHLLQDLKGRVNDRSIYVTMIGRRSKEFAGTRFLKRGANDEGHVANEVETEQVVHDASTTLHDSGRYTSFLQLRGSVPSFWSQDLSQVIKPGITIDRASPFSTPAALHFASCFKRFGAPITCLNLVKRNSKESPLSVELEASIAYLNQFLPPEHHIRYVHKDMSHIFRDTSMDVMSILETVVEHSFKATGFFHNGPELYCHKLQPNPDYKAVGGYGYRNGYVGRDQTGILRVNCVDCLDRTNTAQFIAGKCALGYQLYALGLLSEPKLPFDCDAVRILERAYEDLGDTVAVQYGGSQLVHRVQTYDRSAQFVTKGRDLLQTIQRYYRNAFTDTDKQMAINVFLGVFKPKEGTTDIWDLPTDYYLHHTLARVPLKCVEPQELSHTKWWSESLLRSLPLPHLQVERKLVGNIKNKNEQNQFKRTASMDSFDEVYKTFELTDFDSLLSWNFAQTMQSHTDTSPFVAKEKWQPPATVTKPNLPDPSTLCSSTEQTDYGGITTMEAYGFELKEPSSEDMRLYERYACLHSHMLTKSELSSCEPTPQSARDELAKWEPKHLYKGSVFSIEPPTVSLKDEAIYEEAARVAQTGVKLHPPGKESMEQYMLYVKLASKQLPQYAKGRATADMFFT